jgi:hypothetical protein
VEGGGVGAAVPGFGEGAGWVAGVGEDVAFVFAGFYRGLDFRRGYTGREGNVPAVERGLAVYAWMLAPRAEKTLAAVSAQSSQLLALLHTIPYPTIHLSLISRMEEWNTHPAAQYSHNPRSRPSYPTNPSPPSRSYDHAPTSRLSALRKACCNACWRSGSSS